MSKYRIYRIDEVDPTSVSKRVGRLKTIYSVVALLMLLIYLIVFLVFKLSFILSYSAMLLVILSTYILIHYKAKAENQRIATIGDIEFTRICIIKHISDITSEITYDNISSIELTRHIPAINDVYNRSGYSTFVLTLSFYDEHKEKLVVSDRPYGKSKGLNISETIRTLEKISAVNIILN